MTPFCAFALLPLQKQVSSPCCHALGSAQPTVGTRVRMHTRCVQPHNCPGVPRLLPGPLPGSGQGLCLGTFTPSTPPLLWTKASRHPWVQPSTCMALRLRVEAEVTISCPQIKAMDPSESDSPNAGKGSRAPGTARPPALPCAAPSPLSSSLACFLSCCACVWVYLETRSFQLNCKMKCRDHNSSNSFIAHTHTPTSILPPMR